MSMVLWFFGAFGALVLTCLSANVLTCLRAYVLTVRALVCVSRAK